MKLGFVSALLGDLSFEQVIEFAAQSGFQCVEVMCWPPGKADRRYAGVTHIDVLSLDDAAIDRIGRLCRDAGVEISGIGYYPNLLAPDRDEAERGRQHFERVIQAAPRLGVRVVTGFVGRDYTKSVDDNWPRLLDVWRPLVALAEREQVKIAIENCPMLFSRDEWPGGKNIAVSPAIWRRMYADIPSANWGLNFDPSHFVWQFMDYLPALREFRSRLYHIHAKDLKIDRQKMNDHGILGMPGETHIPKLPGLGDVDWGAFCATLNEIGYNGPVCVEVEDRSYEHSLEARKSALTLSLRYLRNFIADHVERS